MPSLSDPLSFLLSLALLAFAQFAIYDGVGVLFDLLFFGFGLFEIFIFNL